MTGVGRSPRLVGSAGQRSPRGRLGDGGQVPTALVVVVLLGAVFVGVLGVLAVGRATTDAGGARTAADAAALAGAQEERRSVLAVLDAGPLDLDGLDLAPVGCGQGRGAAAEYAARNGGELLGYCYDPRADRVEVLVREDGADGPVEARAVAALGAALGPCTVDGPPPPPQETTPPAPAPGPAPEPSGEVPPSPPPPPPPPPDVDVDVRCGDLELGARLDGGSGASLGLIGLDAVEDALRPRLIG